MSAAAHIREYGGTLEHFWIEAVKDRTDAEYLDAREIPASCEVDGTFFSPRGELAKLLHGDRGEVERRAAQNEEKAREIVTAIRSDRDAVSRGTMVGMAGNCDTAGPRGSPRFPLPVRAFRRDGAGMSGFPR